MKKSILSIGLTIALSLSFTATTFAATKAVKKAVTKSVTKPVAKTITFKSYSVPVTLAVTNVTAQVTKDFSLYLTDDKKTIAGKKSIVLTCKAPMTLTLMPNNGQKNVGTYSFNLCYDGNKTPQQSVKANFKYYSFNPASEEIDFSKKPTKPTVNTVFADGSSYTLTKAGTYVLRVQPVEYGPGDATPVFIIVK